MTGVADPGRHANAAYRIERVTGSPKAELAGEGVMCLGQTAGAAWSVRRRGHVTAITLNC
jgi:hypothetical protein